jgi:hypothetical protein
MTGATIYVMGVIYVGSLFKLQSDDVRLDSLHLSLKRSIHRLPAMLFRRGLKAPQNGNDKVRR